MTFLDKNVRLILLAVFAFLACTFLRQTNALDASYSFVLPGEAVRYAYDGDTIYVNCLEGLRCTNGKLGIRALGMDTPEMRGKCRYEIELARNAKQHLVALMRSASVIVVTPNASRPYDKYGRLLAAVSFDGVDWAESIISAGLGRVWTGKRGGWCV